jgi:glycosyltransferase involved in cell wall biosynthesis
VKISIVTVSYNSASVLEECLKSVSAQSHDETEHIVIDGASTDGTSKVLNAWRGALAAVVSEPDGGIYEAMNKGVRYAQGEVVGFLNSDDIYEGPDVLKCVARLFSKDPKLEACYADLLYTDQADISRVVRYWQSGEFSLGQFSKSWCPPHPTFFVRRSVYERFGTFNLTYRIAADVELMMRFLEVHRIRVCYVPEVWVRMRMGGTTNRSIRNIWAQNREIQLALRSHGLSSNRVSFFGYKLFSRCRQFFQRPKK